MGGGGAGSLGMPFPRELSLLGVQHPACCFQGTCFCSSSASSLLSSPYWSPLSQFFLGTRFNLLLICLPFAAASRFAGWGDGPTCILSMVALTPLAEVRGFGVHLPRLLLGEGRGGLAGSHWQGMWP